MKKRIYEKSHTFILYEDEDSLILSVLCGTVGVYEVVFELNEQELSNYERDGNNYIDLLAADVLNHPKSYLTR